MAFPPGFAELPPPMVPCSTHTSLTDAAAPGGVYDELYVAV